MHVLSYFTLVSVEEIVLLLMDHIKHSRNVGEKEQREEKKEGRERIGGRLGRGWGEEGKGKTGKMKSL